MPRGTPSTQINVTVGSGGLSDKAKQLQTAARQGQLEKERQQRVEAEGTEQRNSKLKAEGKAPDGSPLYNVPFNQPQIDRRPAANRPQTFNYGQGYFTVTRGTNDIAVISVRSGDKTASTTVELTGSGIPEGFRDKTGVDALPYVTSLGGDITSQQPYFITSTAFSDYVYDASGNVIEYTRTRYMVAHGGVRLINNVVSYTTAYTAESGGWAQFSSAANTDLVVLPISSSLAIFAYTETRQSFKTYSFCTETAIGRWVTGVETLISIEGSCELAAAATQTSTSKIAFLVGKNFVRQISYSDALFSANASSQRYFPYQVTGEELEGTKETFYDIAAGIRLPLSGVRYFTSTALAPQYLSYTQGLMTVWGEINHGFAASPGVYSALQSGIEPVRPVATYAAIKTKLPLQGQNFKWFLVDEDLDPVLLKRYRGELPEYYGNPFDQNAFVRVRPVRYTYQSDEDYYRWSDWENPAYCRAQAKALGFSDADLTP